jgi:CDP-diacylglycerol--glycerol-3-phosphate 3-phosphatidyltransferase
MADEFPDRRDLTWTVPNILSVVRIFGSLPLILIAIFGQANWFLGLYLCLAFTDLIDGPIARWFNQRSRLGATLDSIADITLNGCLLIGICVMKWDVIYPEKWLIGLVVLSYLLAVSFSLWKFGKIPSYHTYSAKLSHFLVAVSAIIVLLGWTVWPLRIALVIVTLANLESILITANLKQWKKDVSSILAVAKDG